MRKKWKSRLIVFFIILDVYLFFAFTSSTQILIDKGVSEFEASMSSAVYDALGNELLENARFDELFSIHYNKDGDITFISTDSFKLNLLSQSLATKTLRFYEDYCSRGVDVPIGAFTGIRMLSGLGKKVNVKLIHVVSVKCDFVMKFEEAGINQTRQILYFNVTPDVSIVTIGKRTQKVQSMSVMVYDNLIVGKVPSTYLNARIVGKSG